MTTETNTKLAVITDKKKLDLIKAAIGGERKSFPTHAAAAAVFAKAKELAGEGFAAVAQPEESFTEETQAIVALLGTRIEGKDGAKGVNGAKALVMLALPTLEAFAGVENGLEWLRKVAEKESAHVAFRNLRDADGLEELESGVQQVPSTVDEMVASHTRGDGVDTAAFDVLWLPTRAYMKQKLPSEVYDGVPNKAGVLKALRSKDFATSEFEILENAGMFGYISKLLIQIGANWKDEKTGEATPVDTTTIEEWAETRDTFKFTERAAPELNEDAIAKFDFGAL